ncbi:MAG: hypothetical protein ACK4MV_04710 [Beijerinckiaceae bacterium]
MLRILISAGMVAAMAGAAHAAPKCAPGKIYRVSKKVCVDKTDAIRSGVISPRQKASAARKSTRQALLEGQTPQNVTVKERQEGDAPASSQTASAPDAGKVRTIILPPVKNVIGWAGSPFGALVDPWSSDGFSASPETRFSLRFTTAD